VAVAALIDYYALVIRTTFPHDQYVLIFSVVLVALSLGYGGALIQNMWGERIGAIVSSLSERKLAFGKIESDYPMRFITKHESLARWVKKSSTSLQNDILSSGLVLSPYSLVGKSLFYALFLFIVCFPLSIVLVILFHSPIFLLLMAAPAIMFVIPKLRLLSAKGTRKSELEDELAFFTIYASIMHMVGISLSRSFRQVVGSGVFRQVEKDARRILRDETFFFKEQTEALEGLGRYHASEKMQTLLLGYTSQLRSGGDGSLYLERKAQEFLNDMKFRWQNYARSASGIGEMMLSLFFVVPLAIIMSSFVSPSGVGAITTMTVLVIPIMTILALVMISRSQPKTGDIITAGWKIPLIAGAIAGIAVIPFGAIWMCVASAVISASSFIGISVVLQLREITALEKALPQFLRQITEYKKMGIDIQKAFQKIVTESSSAYNEVFAANLRNMARQVELGLSLKEIGVRTRSSLTRLSFFLLSEIAESGGGSPAALEALTDFVSDVNIVKKQTKSMMKLYELLSYATPILIAVVVAMMIAMVSAFPSSSLFPASSEIGVSASASSAVNSTSLGAALIQTGNLLIIISSLCISFLAGKAIDFTTKSTIRIAVNVSIAVLAISLIGPLSHLLVSFL
jgi:flagellar protein FlaJ